MDSILRLEPCLPPLWARGGHAQTVIGHLLPSAKLKDHGQAIRISLPDGDVLAARLIRGSSQVVVYLFHGLGGSTDSTYIQRTALVMLQQGHSVIMANHRGCGEGAGLAHGPYHSGRGEDLSSVIQWGRSQFSAHRHAAIGFSLSGNALLTLVSGLRGQILPDVAISVNAPIDLATASRTLSQGFNRVYDLRFYNMCRSGVLHGRASGGKTYEIPKWGTLHQFDGLYTAPAGGFRDREDYYQSCSTESLLEKISVPTVVMSSHDDPFVKVESYLRARVSANVLLHLEAYGGHMGYITRTKTPLGTSRWQDYAVDESLKFLLK